MGTGVVVLEKQAVGVGKVGIGAAKFLGLFVHHVHEGIDGARRLLRNRVGALIGGADEDALSSIGNYMKGNMKKFLEKESKLTKDQLLEERYKRFRKF